MTLNLATIIREAAKHDPESIAIHFAGKETSYAQLDRDARAFAGALRALGVRAGQHVALLLPNLPEFSVAYYGALYAGAAVVPLNVLLTGEEIAYHLVDSDAVALVSWQGFRDATHGAFGRVQGCEHWIEVAAGDAAEGAHSFSALVQGGAPVEELPATRPDDTAVILYTSGTTGRPKGAELTHFNLYYNAEYVATELLPGAGKTSLACLPLFHSFGQTVVQNGTFRSRGTVVMMPRFDVVQAMGLMSSLGVTLFAGVPTMYFAILHHPEASNYDLSKLKYCVSGGSAMPVEVMRSFDSKYGVDILEGYGLSETSPVASFNTLDRPKKPGSIGLPLRGVEFRLEDAKGEIVTELNVPGEICIKGHNVMKGYYKRPEDSALAIVDGWFHSGDIGTRDEQGYYYIVDRKKDMVIRGGYNVYPREIEEVLYGHPAIAEAAVIGVPHPSHGEEVKAVVALKPNQAVLEADIVAYCKERLAAYKYPRIVEIVASLPKGPTGKILKRELRAPKHE